MFPYKYPLYDPLLMRAIFPDFQEALTDFLGGKGVEFAILFLEDPDTRAPLTRLGTGRIFDRLKEEWNVVKSIVMAGRNLREVLDAMVNIDISW